MKQGRATHSSVGSTKTEPVSKAVSPGYAAELGNHYVGKSCPMYEGRGLEAPMKSTTSHPHGSQGKH